MKKNEIESKLQDAGLHADALGKGKDGCWTVRRGFFYRSQAPKQEEMVAAVKAAGFVVVDQGEVHKAFNGGERVARQSHVWVKFQEPKQEEQTMKKEEPKVEEKAQEPKQEKSRFQKGSGCYTCKACGKQTRSTGRGDNEHVGLCADCYDRCSDFNSVSDGQMTVEQFEAAWGKGSYAKEGGEEQPKQEVAFDGKEELMAAANAAGYFNIHIYQKDGSYHITDKHEAENVRVLIGRGRSWSEARHDALEYIKGMAAEREQDALKMTRKERIIKKVIGACSICGGWTKTGWMKKHAAADGCTCQPIAQPTVKDSREEKKAAQKAKKAEKQPRQRKIPANRGAESKQEVMNGLLKKGATMDEMVKVFTGLYEAGGSRSKITPEWIKSRVEIYAKIGRQELGL